MSGAFPSHGLTPVDMGAPKDCQGQASSGGSSGQSPEWSPRSPLSVSSWRFLGSSRQMESELIPAVSELELGASPALCEGPEMQTRS